MAFGDTITEAVLGKVSVPEDTDNAPNVIAEGAAVNTTVGITAHSTFANGNASLDYSLSADSSGGGFKIDQNTGVVTVADPSKIDFESAPGHLYTITVLATKNNNFSSSQTFTISVNDVAPSAPVDSNAAANTVLEGAANGTAVGITASSTDVNGGAVTYSLIGDTSGGGFTINATTGVVTVADGSKIDFESAPGHAYTVTVQSSDGTLTSSQAFTINVGDVAMTTPVDNNAAANTVAEGAAAGTTVGITASATDPSGPATTYSLIGDTSGGGFTINASTGVVTVANPAKIDFESSGAGHSYNITVQASNGVQTTSQVFTVGVTDVAPSAPTDSNAAANTVVEGAANGTVVGVTASSTDVNGPAVTYSLIGDTSGGGFAINPTTGVITVADSTKINFETAPGHAYTVTAQSSDGTLTNSQTFTIAVSDVAPTAPVDSNGATNTVAEGAANGSTVGVTAFSTDVNGPGVTYSLVGDTSGGGFTINSTTGVITVADGTKLDYETTPGHAYTVTAQASDGTLTNSQTFTIAVTDVAPSAPTDINGATNTVAEGAANGSTVGITASSVDPNGPATTYSLSDSAGGRFAIDSSTGVVTVANGAAIDFETAPGPGHSYGITVLATNGALTTSSAFSIGVTDVAPSAPTDSDGAANTVVEGAANGTVVGITASSTDPGGGPAPTYTLSDNAGGRFAIDPTTGIVTVANGAAIDFETAPGHAYGITVQVTAGALSTTQNFTIAVSDVAPSAPLDSDGATNTVAEGAANGSTVGVTAFSTDVNGPGVTYSLVGDTSGGGFAINPTTGVITVADGTKLDYETTPGHAYTVTAQASDGTLTNSQTFTIAVTDVAPSAPTDTDGAPNSIAEGAANGSTVGITASSVDPNGPATTYTLSDSAGGRFAIDSSTGVVTVANGAAIDFETAAGHAYGITVLATNGALSTSSAFSIGVTDVAPSAPTDSDGAGDSVFEGAANGTVVGITASSTDPGGGPAPTYTLSDSAGGRFAIDPTTGIVTVANGAAIDFETAPGPGHSYGITVQATAGALSTTQNFSISVGDVNEAPAGTDKTVTMLEGDSYTFSVADFGFSDPGDSVNPNSLLAVKMTTVPGGGTGTFTNNGVTVNAGDSVSATDIADGLLVFTPTAHSNGAPEATFTFQVQDNGGILHGGVDLDQSPNTVTINVNAVNDAPVNSVPLATQSVNEEATLTFSAANLNAITIDDIDVGSGNETVTLSVTSGILALGSHAGLVSFTPDNAAAITLTGTIANIDNALNGLTYTGNLDFHGTDTLHIVTNDNGNTGAGGPQSDTDDVSITVHDVADTPSVTNATTNEDTQSASGLVVSRNATDSTDVAFFKITGITHGTLFQSDGTTPISNGDFITFAEANAGLKFTPAADFFGNGSFNVQASTSNSDAGLGGSLATATITVDPVADTPSVTNATTNEDVQSASGLVVSHNAADGAEVGFVKITGITNGTLFQHDGTTAISNGDFITFAEANAGLKFTPTADFFGNGSFDVQASTTSSDAGLGGSPVTATITVDPVADTPSVTNATTNEDTQSTTGLVVSHNPVDGAEVGFVKITGITNGTLFQHDGTTAISNGDFITFTEANAGLKFTPAADFNGNGSFNVQASTSASDAGLGGSVQTATITVDPVNDAPTLTAHDRDPVYAPGGVQLFDSTTVSVGPADESTQNIKQLVLTVSDVDGTGTTDHLSIDGTDVFLTNGNTAVGAGHGVDISVALSGGTATVTISKAAGDIPAGDVVSIVNGLTYTNDAVSNGETPRNVTIASIQDDGGGTAPNVDTSTPTPAIISTVTFNQAPVITTDGGGPTASKSIAENTTAVTQVQATDPDSGPSPVSYSIVLGNDSAKFGIDGTGHLAFLSAPDFENPNDVGDTAGNNTYVVTVRASDGSAFDDQTITVTVTDANDAPVITSNGGGATASVNVNENSTAVTTITATDQDVPAQTLTYSVLTGAGSPDGGKFTVDGTGHLSFSSAPNFEAPGSAAASNAYTVQVQVTDSGAPAMHDIQTITVNVQDVNEAPDTAPSTVTGTEDAASIAITINGSDVDAGDHVATFHITNIPNTTTQGTLYSDAGLTTPVTEGADVTATSNAVTLYFVPKPDFNTHAGAVTFNAAATDTHNLTDATPAVQTINVTAVNDGPINHAPANSDLGTAFSNTDFALSGAASFSVVDVDAGESVPGDIHVTLGATHGNVSVTLNGTTVAGGTNGSHSVTLDGTVAQVNAALASLVYHSDDGYTGSDTVTMHTDDLGHSGSGGAKTADASVDIGIVPQVFVIDNTPAGAGNNGSLTDPFNSIASFNTNANDGAGDYIYVNAGTYSEADGINLVGSEHLYGQGQTLTFTNPVTGQVVTIGTGSAGNTPTISVTGAGAHGIDLGADDQVTGLNVATTAGSQIGVNDSGASVGNLSISDVDVTGAGKALEISHGGALSVTLDQLTSTGSTTQGVNLGGGLTGTLAINSTSGTSAISGASGTDFNLAGGGSLSATFNGNITQASNAAMVSVAGGHTGTLTFQNGTLSATNGTGLQFDNSDGTYNFNGTNTLNGGDAGVDIVNGSNGAFSFSTNSSITNPSGVAFNVNGGTGNIDYNGTIAKNSAGQAISVVNHTAGNVNFDGSVASTSSSTGINLTGNTSAVMTFDGGVNVSTSSGTGFNATTGGTLIVTGTTANNHLTTNTGTAALNVNGVTIGTGGLNFHDINANGDANGIVLNNTGTTDGLNVTGSGAASRDGTGGTITATTGDGVLLTSTSQVSLTHMNITSTGGQGVSGSAVNGFVSDWNTFTANGNATKEGAIRFGSETDPSATGLTGGAIGSPTETRIDNTLISGSFERGVSIFNNSGTLTQLNVHGTTIQNSTNGSGMLLELRDNAVATADLQNSTFTGNKAAGFQGTGTDTSNLTVNAIGAGGHANTFSNNNDGVLIGSTGSADVATEISGNTFSGNTPGVAITVSTFLSSTASGSLSAKILNNTITMPDTALNDGIQSLNSGTGTVQHVKIDGNTITNAGTGNGIFIGTPDNGSSPNYTAIVTNNIINQTHVATAGTGAGNGIEVAAFRGTGVFKVEGNTVNFPNSLSSNPNSVNDLDGIFLVQSNNGTTTSGTASLERGTSGSNTASVVLAANNPNAHASQGGPATFVTGTFTVVNNGTITLPLNAAPGGVAAGTPEQAASTGDYHLTQAVLDTVVAAAISQWAAAGASASQLAAMHAAASTITVDSLSGPAIGDESSGHIVIDTDAAGHGWFVDPTPNDNSEFTHAANAAGTDLYTDATSAAAGHLDLLTTVSHELGHVVGLDDSTNTADANDLMFINLVDGERRLPDATDVAQASSTSAAETIEANLPQSAQAAAGTAIVVGTAANDTIDAGHGGNILFGGAGADNFVFGPSIQLNAPTPAQITHVADYHAAEGDTFDFSALTSAFHNSGVNDSLVVRAVEDASGKFATLQVDHIDPMGLPSAPNWVSVAQLDGAHAGDSVNVLIDNNHSVHLAQIHVDLLV